MKILQVVPYFSPAWACGGIVRVVYELSRELVRKGHEVTVFTTDVFDQHSRLPGPLAKTRGLSPLPHGVAGTNVDGISVFYFRNLSNALAFNQQLFLPYSLIRQSRKSVRKFDVIHMHGHRHLLNNIIRRRAKQSGVPYVFSAHGTLPRIERRLFAKRIFDLLFGNRVLKGAARFTAVSKAEVKQYEAFGIPPYRVSVTYNGIDTNAFQNLPSKGTWRKRHNIADDERIILYLGKITQRKGLDVLLEAFEQIEDQKTRLFIAGPDHGYGDELDNLITSLDHATWLRVKRLGHMDGNEKREALVDADVLTYPSTLEVFGLVPFEAILCGTPVIVTDDSGCGEIIGAANAGRVIPYGNPAVLKGAILETLGDRKTSARQITNGRAHIHQHLTWPLVTDRVLRAYESVLRTPEDK